MWIENDDDKQQQNNGQPNLNVGAGGGTSSTPPGSNPSTVSSVQTNQPQQKFATVQDYLGANKQQGNELGQKFTSNLTEAANKDKSQIDTAVAGAQNDINAGTINYNPDIVNKAQNDPASVANNPGDINSFLKQWNASYSGPSSLEASTSYEGAAGAANDASQKAEQLKTSGGRETLIKDQFGNNSDANTALDQGLLQNSDSFSTVQDAAPAFKSIQDYLGSQSQAVAAQAEKAAADTAKTQQDTRGAFTNSLSNFQSDLNSKVDAARKDASDVGTGIKKDLSGTDLGKISQDFKSAGVSDDTIKNINSYLTSLDKSYGVRPDLSQGYSYNPNVAITPENVASKEDYAKADALNKLTGVDYSGVIGQGSKDKAGTAGGANKVDAESLAPKLKAQLAQKDQALLDKPVNIGEDLRNMADPKLAEQYAQNYIDAIGRQGGNVKDSPILKDLWKQAQTAFLKYSGRPDVQSGMQAILKQLLNVYEVK